MAESADARDSKSRGINFPCGFKSHLRYLQLKDLRQFDVSPFFIDGDRVTREIIIADPHCLCLRRHDEVLLQRIGLIRHFAARNAGRWLTGSVCADLEPSDCLSWPISVESYNDKSLNAASLSTSGDVIAAGAGCGIVLMWRPWLCPGNSSIPIARILPSMSTRLSFTRSC